MITLNLYIFVSGLADANIQYLFFLLLLLAWDIHFLYKFTDVVGLFDSTIYLQKLGELCENLRFKVCSKTEPLNM